MNLSEEIFSRYGFVKRARGCFLYTQKSRLVDLFQEDGRAILGWGGTGGSITAFTMFKNALSRGLTLSFKTSFDAQSDKAVSLLFNSKRRALFFYGEDDARAFCKQHSFDFVFYVPWDCEKDITDKSCIVFKLPLAWCESVYVAAVKEELLCDFNQNEAFSPALRAAANRSIYDLIKALQTRKEKQWFLYDSVLHRYFTRRGPYLTPKVPQEKYTDFVLHCLDCKIVINPNYDSKSIVPFGADAGVFSELKKNPFENF